MLTKDLDGPLDPCEDLTSEQLDNLNGWIERFDEKVSSTCVGCERNWGQANCGRSTWL
jgi:hypothetical protein